MKGKLIERLLASGGWKTNKREPDDGFVEVRRKIVFGFPAFLFLSPMVALGRSMTIDGNSWDNFLKECVPRAAELHKDTSPAGQDAYLFWLASMSAKLDAASMPKGKLASFANLDPPVETGPAYFGKPFFIIEWRMAPNAYLPPHNHPNISVCTVCTDGEAVLRNYQPEGAVPDFGSMAQFNVRQTNEQLLTAGRMNCLSSSRDNIHTFKAGKKGARGFDITTYHGKDAGFSFLEIASKASGADDRMFEATWTKR